MSFCDPGIRTDQTVSAGTHTGPGPADTTLGNDMVLEYMLPQTSVGEPSPRSSPQIFRGASSIKALPHRSWRSATWTWCWASRVSGLDQWLSGGRTMWSHITAMPRYHLQENWKTFTMQVVPSPTTAKVRHQKTHLRAPVHPREKATVEDIAACETQQVLYADWQTMASKGYPFDLDVPDRLPLGGDFFVLVRKAHACFVSRFHWISLKSVQKFVDLWRGTIREREMSPGGQAFPRSLPVGAREPIYRRSTLNRWLPEEERGWRMPEEEKGRPA